MDQKNGGTWTTSRLVYWRISKCCRDAKLNSSAIDLQKRFCINSKKILIFLLMINNLKEIIISQNLYAISVALQNIVEMKNLYITECHRFKSPIFSTLWNLIQRSEPVDDTEMKGFLLFYTRLIITYGQVMVKLWSSLINIVHL